MEVRFQQIVVPSAGEWRCVSTNVVSSLAAHSLALAAAKSRAGFDPIVALRVSAGTGDVDVSAGPATDAAGYMHVFSSGNKSLAGTT